MYEIHCPVTGVIGFLHPFQSRFSTIFFLFLLSSILSKVDCGRWELGEEDPDHIPLISEMKRRRDASGDDEFDYGEIIPPKYNVHVGPPTANGTPTHVQMAILIVNVRDIKDLSEELTLEVNMKMSWKDERLRHLADWAKEHGEPFIVLQPDTLLKLWHPDIYIDHVKTITQPSIASKPASLRVYQDSTLRYSARLTLAQSCQMDFHYYPADTQRCSVDLMSYAYSDAKLNLTWKDGRSASLVRKLVLPNVDLGLANPESFLIVTSSGRYAGLRFTVLLRRKLSYHLLQTYLPSTLFIFVSWQSFLVPPDSVPGRMALCMTTLLTLTAMFSSVRQNIPNVSYIKAIDVWMVSCIIFVFLTLLEYTILLRLKTIGGLKMSKGAKKQRKRKGVLKGFQMNRIRSDGIDGSSLPSAKSPYEPNLPFITNQVENNGRPSLIGSSPAVTALCSSVDLNLPPTSRPESVKDKEDLVFKIERQISILIPSLFILFNFVYWPWLLYMANYYQQFNSTVYYSAF